MKCEECGENVSIPFICSYCGGTFCSRHRLPEYHGCNNQPRKSPPYLSPDKPPAQSAPERREYSGSFIGPKSVVKKRFTTRRVMGLFITIAVALVAVYFFNGYFISPTSSPTSSPATSPIAIAGRVIAVVGSSVLDGDGLSGIELRVIDSKGIIVMTNKTNATGHFSFADLPPGSYVIEVVAPDGYVTRSADSYSVTYSRNVEFRLQDLHTNPKTLHYNYVLRGASSEITFIVYEGMYDYLVSIENSQVSYVGEAPSQEEVDRIITMRYINEGAEKGELVSLVKAIKKVTPNEDDQVRIAISLVQNIPYDWGSTNDYDWKYPYEILYLNKGVCSEKSHLLVCLLRELGYGCSVLKFTSQNHAAVGIACPSQYAYYSGYAFVECSTPTIITYWYGDYVGAGKLPSSPSYAIVIQDGKVMNSISEEYQDAQTYLSLINMGPVLDEYHYTLWQNIVDKYGIQVS